jgi:hypothetical protein
VPIVRYEGAGKLAGSPRSRKCPPKRDCGWRRSATPPRGTVEKLHSHWRHQRGRLPSAPLISATSWLRGLDLNQRPLGYEGKSALHTNQRDPTGTNNDGDLRGDEVVRFWFGSVRLLHRAFIGGSEPPRILAGSLRAARSSIHRTARFRSPSSGEDSKGEPSLTKLSLNRELVSHLQQRFKSRYLKALCRSTAGPPGARQGSRWSENPDHRAG